MSAQQVVYQVEPSRAAELLDRVQATFTGGRVRSETSEATYLDTFDWRVLRAHASLAVSSDGEKLAWLAPDEPEPLTAALHAVPPAFAWDVAPGALRERLQEVLDVRRAFPVAEVRRRSRTLDLLDHENKTVARVQVQERFVRPPSNGGAAVDWCPVPSILVLHSLRGYEREFDLFERFLCFNLELPRHDASEYEDALSGLDGGPVDRRRRRGQDPTESADRALRAVLSDLLDDIERNVPGTIGDLDTEFLHDLRVATRKSRALLSEFDTVLPRAATEHYGGALRRLGRATGPTRDLDTNLLALAGYRRLLRPEDIPGLEPFVEVLSRRRAKARAQLAQYLESDEFRAFLTNWREFLANPLGEARRTADGARRIVVVAVEHVASRLDKVLASGREVTPESDPAQLHELRIRCKKLRYLLEAFGGLVDSRRRKRALADLERMQGVLGEVNDLAIHVELIEKVACEEASSLSARTLLVLGRLAARLDLERERSGSRFFERFRRFTKESRVERLRRALEEARKEHA